MVREGMGIPSRFFYSMPDDAAAPYEAAFFL